jgi:thiamine biosynthesis protein ThiS
MKLIIDGRKKTLSHKGDIASLLRKLKIRREEVVVKLNGRLAPETAALKARDEVEVLRVVFGG